MIISLIRFRRVTVRNSGWICCQLLPRTLHGCAQAVTRMLTLSVEERTADFDHIIEMTRPCDE
jgi:hypothetical protein